MANLNHEQPSSVEEIIETGVLDNWYLVARDTDVDTTPVGLTRLSRDIVLWRDGAGALHCVEDFCPHRGAKLSLGKVCNGNVACAYHGVEVNGAGEIAAVPTEPNSPFIGRKSVRHYPVQERHGAIWVYFGVDEAAEPPELRFPDEFYTGEWSGFVDIRQFECNYQLVRDNQIDPVHGSFLHVGTHALTGAGEVAGDIGFERTERGFVVWRKYQQGVNLDRTEVFRYEGSGFWAVTDLPYQDNEGGGTVRLFRYPTPIDRDNCLVYNYRLRKMTGWKLDLWRFIYKNRAASRGVIVLEQDRVALAAIPSDARDRELLLQLDLGVSHIRRMYRDEAERQFEAISVGASVAAE
jgi:phenylpropionate dioxygenase-like ring-hydroxylating dioxygenase large terminal subunit